HSNNYHRRRRFCWILLPGNCSNLQGTNCPVLTGESSAAIVTEWQPISWIGRWRSRYRGLPRNVGAPERFILADPWLRFLNQSEVHGGRNPLTTPLCCFRNPAFSIRRAPRRVDIQRGPIA